MRDPDVRFTRKGESITTLLSGLPLDFNGHMQRGRLWDDETGYWARDKEDRERRFRDDLFFLPSARAALRPILDGETEPSQFVLAKTDVHLGCPFCDEHLVLESDGRSLRISPPCPNPEGNLVFEWELNVPSGKLLVSPMLTSVFRCDAEQRSEGGMARLKAAALYAEEGLAVGLCGEPEPDLVRMANGRYSVAKTPPPVIWDSECQRVTNPEFPGFEGENLGCVSDGRVYAIADSEDARRRIERFGLQEEFEDALEIQVRPGVYKFRQDFGARAHGLEERFFEWATFEWCREPDVGTTDTLERYLRQHVTAEQYVRQQARRWPTLFGAADGTPWERMTDEQRQRSAARVADHIFCVIGGGTVWHPNGHPEVRLDADLAALQSDQLPDFADRPQVWYPVAKDFSRVGRLGGLNESFAKLARMVLESCLRHGPGETRNPERISSTMTVMRDAYQDFRGLYPHLVNPGFESWLEATNFQAHVAEFTRECADRVAAEERERDNIGEEILQFIRKKRSPQYGKPKKRRKR